MIKIIESLDESTIDDKIIKLKQKIVDLKEQAIDDLSLRLHKSNIEDKVIDDIIDSYFLDNDKRLKDYDDLDDEDKELLNKQITNIPSNEKLREMILEQIKEYVEDI